MQFNRKKIHYKVDIESRTVTATYPFSQREALEELENIFHKAFSQQSVVTDLTHFTALQHPDVIILHATAKCHPDDEFDVQKGMDICYHRLILAFYREKHRIATNLKSCLYGAFKRTGDMIKSLEQGYIKVSAILNDDTFDAAFAEYDNVSIEDLRKFAEHPTEGNTIFRSIAVEKNFDRVVEDRLTSRGINVKEY